MTDDRPRGRLSRAQRAAQHGTLLATLRTASPYYQLRVSLDTGAAWGPVLRLGRWHRDAEGVWWPMKGHAANIQAADLDALAAAIDRARALVRDGLYQQPTP